MTTTTQHHDAIDWQQCLTLANNNAEIANDLMTLFIADLPVVIKTMKQLLANEDYHGLKDQAHRLHGATCYCGVPRLKIAVQNLEKHLKNDESKKLPFNNIKIKVLFDKLLDEISSVQATYAQNTFRER
jgi:two-component system, NarL family, sensor histidine kinase BarA